MTARARLRPAAIEHLRVQRWALLAQHGERVLEGSTARVRNAEEEDVGNDLSVLLDASEAPAQAGFCKSYFSTELGERNTCGFVSFE